MGCEIPQDAQEYPTPEIPYAQWSTQKLEKLGSIVAAMIDESRQPVLVVFELGHFKLPKEEKNLTWARQNVDFADRLAGRIIKRYGKSVRLLATLLINNLEEEQEAESEEILHMLFEKRRYITLRSLKILSERNLKNRAYKALKNNSRLAESFIHIDGKAYLKDEEYEHDLAAGFVSPDGDIIPRCGLILTSFLDKVAALAHERMFPHKKFETIFISFCEEYHEYQRVKLGVDIYSSAHDNITITPVVLHWDYSRDRCLVSRRRSGEKTWRDLELRVRRGEYLRFRSISSSIGGCATSSPKRHIAPTSKGLPKRYGRCFLSSNSMRYMLPGRS